MLNYFPPLLFVTPFVIMSALYYPRATSIALASFLPLLLLAKISRPVRYYLRVTAFLVGLGLASFWGVVVSVFMSLVGRSKDINWVVARSFHGMVAPLCGIRFETEGTEHLHEGRRAGQPAVVIGNHQTMLDILYLGKIFPRGCSIMAKKELQWAPLLGQFMTLSNAVFVNRSKRADAVAVFAKVAKTMKEKVISLFIFPEGTRSASATPTLLPFKKGAFHLAVQAQIPIVPIVCENYAAAYSSKHKRFDGGDLMIKVLPSIPTEGLTSSSEDISELVAKTQAAMLEALESLAARRLEINKAKGIKTPSSSGPTSHSVSEGGDSTDADSAARTIGQTAAQRERIEQQQPLIAKQ